jgi:cytosine/adenosine deaminase-related metal-dependent hydrolase/ubiquinone/menaquinone biosynthesis C-methylase UbiE
VKTRAGSATATLAQPDAHVFDRWAQVYDTRPNPLLLLEERKAKPLLPILFGGNVLDVGCGTGRWLRYLESLAPASISGIDYSPAMLERAREKVRSTTKLQLGECSSLPADDSSRSFVMASFVLSYVKDLPEFARECARILQAGGRMLISDMHPATAAEQGWTRSFRLDGETTDIAVHSRSLREIVAAFQENGFEGRVLIEPSFEEPEKVVFANVGKLEEYEMLVGVPAIYILTLQKQRPHIRTIESIPDTTLQLTNAPIDTGENTWRDGVVAIEGGHVAFIGDGVGPATQELDLSGYVLLPGLINAHDHLDFGLFPRLGRREGASRFHNSSEWAREIHLVHSEVIDKYRQIPMTAQLWWGAIRNLLCGVTTVCHHNPLYQGLTLPDFPVRVLSGFGWSHSLAFDPDLANKFQSSKREEPFILHAGEGIDEQSRRELWQLDRMHVLDERTVVVHGLACTSREISLINLRGASLVVCPSSNRFLFGRTLPGALLTSFERLALGSDSPLTAEGDLLDDLRYLHTETGLDANLLYNMVTTNPATMLRLQDSRGRIRESGVADLIAVRDQYETPVRTVSRLTFSDVQLVILAGRVQMASPELYTRLPHYLRSGMELIEIAGHQRWIRASLQRLFHDAQDALGQENLLLSGREVRYLGTPSNPTGSGDLS